MKNCCRNCYTVI